ncbi:MAG: hypothetical protein ACO1NX_09135, partial [Chitinophagaceae bacterium]
QFFPKNRQFFLPITASIVFWNSPLLNRQPLKRILMPQNTTFFLMNAQHQKQKIGAEMEI